MLNVRSMPVTPRVVIGEAISLHNRSSVVIPDGIHALRLQSAYAPVLIHDLLLGLRYVMARQFQMPFGFVSREVSS